MVRGENVEADGTQKSLVGLRDIVLVIEYDYTAM